MERIEDIIAAHAGAEGALLPILHDVKQTFGRISEDAVRAIAAALNFSRAEVHGVVSFYPDFSSDSGQPHRVELCRAEACQARGVEALVAALSGDARSKLGTVYCLGLCSVGPSAMVDGVLHARLDAERLSALVEHAR